MHFINAKGILSSKNGMNIYRGCTHGCIYCDSRSLCYQMKHSFENIEVKENAPELLEQALKRKRKKCMIGTGAMSDPYMHCEKDLLLTRKCLEIINKYSFGVSVLTKSDLVERDIDLFSEINKKSKAVVQMTMTTFDEKLCSIIEPNVCGTHRRYEILMKMKECNIPTVVWLSPILPFINDNEENLRGILKYCFDAGVKGIMCFDFGTTMRNGSREYFYSALDKSFKGVRELYEKKYGLDYICPSENNFKLMNIFREQCKKHNVIHNVNQIFKYIGHFEEKSFEQLSLF